MMPTISYGTPPSAQAPADGALAAAEHPLPQTVTENHLPVLTLLPLGLSEYPPAKWPDPKKAISDGRPIMP